MKNRAFHWETKDIIAQFIAAFDDVVIGRYNRDREERDTIAVAYVYSPKRRVIHDLENRSQNLNLPIVAVTMGGITRNASRSFNKAEGFTYPNTRYPGQNATSSARIPPAVPIDIDVNMSILTSYQSDLDQIVSNFAAYANPYIMISWKVPEAMGLPAGMIINSKVEWSGSTTFDYPVDINHASRSVITADTSFRIEGWLFKEEVDPLNHIYYIESNFHSNNSLSAGNYITYDSYNTLSGSNSVLDTITLSGTPTITNAYFRPEDRSKAINITNTNYTISTPGSIVLYGTRFEEIDYVMLSGGNNFYGNNTSLSGFDYFPDLTAAIIPLSSYRVVTDNILEIDIVNELNNSGKFDIVVVTPAGWFTSYESIAGHFIKP